MTISGQKRYARIPDSQPPPCENYLYHHPEHPSEVYAFQFSEKA